MDLSLALNVRPGTPLSEPASPITRAPLIAERRWSQLVVSLSRIPPTMDPFVVSHQNMHHLTLLTDGFIRVQKRELHIPEWKLLDMKTGDIHLCSAGSPPYELGWSSGVKCELRAIHVHLDSNVTARASGRARGAGSLGELASGLIRDPLIEQLMRNLARSVEGSDDGDALFIDAAVELLALQLVREHGPRGNLEPRPYRGLAPAKLKRICEYIDAHLPEEIRLRDLASEVQLSNWHFLRAFKAATGLTPHAYVSRCRVDRAKQLIGDSDRSLAEIARLAGFATQSHMATRFRSVAGATPSAFRRLRVDRAAKICSAAPATFAGAQSQRSPLERLSEEVGDDERDARPEPRIPSPEHW